MVLAGMAHRQGVQRYKRATRTTLAPEEAAEIKSAFDLFDHDRRSRIDYRAMKVSDAWQAPYPADD
jgi:Ca2+-binding EF-hand superfamily protein